MIRENYDLQKKMNKRNIYKWCFDAKMIYRKRNYLVHSIQTYMHLQVFIRGGGGCTHFVLFLILILINTFYPCITNYGAGRQVFNNRESVATVGKLGVRDVCFIDVNNHMTIAGQTRNTSVFSFKLQHITK